MTSERRTSPLAPAVPCHQSLSKSTTCKVPGASGKKEHCNKEHNNLRWVNSTNVAHMWLQRPRCKRNATTTSVCMCASCKATKHMMLGVASQQQCLWRCCALRAETTACVACQHKLACPPKKGGGPEKQAGLEMWLAAKRVRVRKRKTACPFSAQGCLMGPIQG
jgi:hypothetical protein